MKKILLLLLIIWGCKSGKTENVAGTKWQLSDSCNYLRTKGLLKFVDEKEFVDSVNFGFIILGKYNISQDTIIMNWTSVDAVDHYSGIREKVNIDAVKKLVHLKDKLYPVYFAINDSGKYIERVVPNKECYYQLVSN
jgi:hypothetical protein